MTQLTLDAPLRELNVGRALAEQGMARTLAAEKEGWLDAALQALKRFAALPGHETFKIEDFRWWYVCEGLAPPHDHHVWGAVAGTAERAGIITFTHRYAPSVSPKTHGHPVKVWARGATP